MSPPRLKRVGILKSNPLSQSPNWIEKFMKDLQIKKYHSDDVAAGISPAVSEIFDFNENEENQLSISRVWAREGDNYFPCQETVERLPPGRYIPGYDNGKVFVIKQEVSTDELLRLPDSEADKVISEIEMFWTRKERYRKLNLVWKRGVLLFGPPGSGKTSCLQFLSEMIIKAGGITVTMNDPNVTALALRAIRRIEPDTPIVLILEDIDTHIQHKPNEKSVLALLDGELQVDNIVTVATSNYPELLDGRLTNRPSRFDIVRKIDFPTAAARLMYLQHKMPFKEEIELSSWVEKTEKFSVAHLKELIVLVEINDMTLDDAITRIKKLMTDKPSSDNFDKSTAGFGFAGGDY